MPTLIYTTCPVIGAWCVEEPYDAVVDVLRTTPGACEFVNYDEGCEGDPVFIRAQHIVAVRPWHV